MEHTAALAPRPGAASALIGATSSLLFAAVFFGGGSGSGSVPALGAGAVVVLLLAAVLVHGSGLSVSRLGRDAVVVLVSAGALVAWIGATIVWSIAGDRSWAALNKGLLYLGLLALGVVFGALGPRSARTAAAVLGAVLLLAVLWALVGKAVPALDPDGDRVARLRSPVGHWNALALLADALPAFALPLGSAFFGRVAVRGCAAVVVFCAVLAVLLSASRAGIVGALAVIALVLALSPERLRPALLAVSGAVPAGLVAGWAFTRPALVEDGAARADRVADGALFALLGVAGAAMAWGLSLLAPRLLARPRAVARALAVGSGVAAIVAVAALALAVGNPASWAGDQFRQSECVNDPERLTSLCANNRLEWWGEAWQIFEAHPAVGAGANTFAIARKRYRESAEDVTQPHDVPLQLLADSGLVGGTLLAVLAAALAFAAVSAIRRLRGPERAGAAALAALPLAYALHAVVDYDLDFAAVSAPAAFAAGALVAAGRPRSETRPSGLWLLGGVVTALAVGLSLASPALSERTVDRSLDAADAGDLESAREQAELAADLNPLAPDPIWAQAEAAEDERAAEAAYERAVRLQPENPATWYALGIHRLYALEDECGAYFALNEAYTLDPRSRAWSTGGPLDQARRAVNRGACEP